VFTPWIVAGLAATIVATSFLSGIFGMAGGMVLMGFLLATLPVQTAMVMHGIIQMAANGWRAILWRAHVRWSVIGFYLCGAALSVALFVAILFVPDKPLVLIAIGVTPFIALLLPARFAPNILKPGHAVVAGAICTALHLVAGVTGPLLDAFFTRTELSRQANVATKAVTQTTGHILKIVYFGALTARPGDLGIGWELAVGSVALAMLGTTLARRILENMSDRAFYRWTNRLVLSLGTVYIVQGIWQIATR